MFIYGLVQFLAVETPKRRQRVRTESFNATLLSILVITSFTAFLLVATAKPIGASAVEDAENFLPVADSSIVQGYPDMIDSPDFIYNLYVGWNPEYESERAYFRFDFENIPSGATITSAVLWVNSKYGPSGPSYAPTWNLVDAHSVSDDTWDESTLTWNTAPPIGAAILDTENYQADDYLVPELPPSGQYKWYSWDVTSYVTSEFEGGDPLVSICLKRADPENESDSAGWFYSKDLQEYQYPRRPHLTVSWSVPMSASIWPESLTGLPGATLHYIVTVSNFGEAEGDYTLEVTDDEDWELALSENSMTIAAGKSGTTFLSVTIPADADNGDVDHITVTATSVTDDTISDSATCTATVVPTVEVGFIPSGENHAFNFENYEIPVLAVTITVKESVENAEVTVEVLENVEVSTPPGVVYSYENITTNITPANIENLLTKFRVSKSWIARNDIDESTIKLFKFSDDRWQELSTELVDTGTDYLYFEAETQELLLFATTGEKVVEVGVPTEIPWVYILVAIIVIVAIVAAVLILRRPPRVAPKRVRKKRK